MSGGSSIAPVDDFPGNEAARAMKRAVADALDRDGKVG
jgi:hypothetical protein